MLIAFTGRAGAGKSTAADILASLLGGDYETVNFADPVKRHAQAIWQFTDEQLWGPSEARNMPDWRYPRPDGTCLTAREALQKLGTEAGRHCYPNIWIDIALDMVSDASRRVGNVIMADLRFDNEAEAVNDAGGYNVLVSRSVGSRTSEAASAHASEAGISPRHIDYELKNDGTPHDLRQAIKAMLEVFRGE